MSPGGPPVVSWSRVSRPALVLGRSGEPVPVDRGLAAAEGVEVVGRSSGGGPVLWDRDLLALDVVLPRGHPLAPADVVRAYRWIGEAIAGALRRCGVADVEVVGVEQARRARRDGRPAAVACFGGLSPYEVTAGGRKVVGLSQTRRAPGALLQVGIPLRLDAPRLGRLLGDGDDGPVATDLARAAAGLDQVAPALGAERVVEEVDAALCRAAGARLSSSEPTAAERREIAAARTTLSPPARAGS